MPHELSRKSKRITGKELLDNGIEIFELTSAIRDERLTGRDPVTGKLVLDLNTSKQFPAYKNLQEARFGLRRQMKLCGEQTEEEITKELIRSHPNLFPFNQPIEMIKDAIEIDENRVRAVLETATLYPDDTHQYDFNPESHRDDLDDYMAVLHGLRFDPAEVAVAFPDWRPVAAATQLIRSELLQTAVQNVSVEPEDAPEAKPVIRVPAALFVGKAPQAACEALKADGYSDEVIAFILVEKLSTAKDATGKLLETAPISADKIKKYKEKDPRTYREATNKFLEKAKNYEILTE